MHLAAVGCSRRQCSRDGKRWDSSQDEASLPEGRGRRVELTKTMLRLAPRGLGRMDSNGAPRHGEPTQRRKGRFPVAVQRTLPGTLPVCLRAQPADSPGRQGRG